jgi:hypothetical protein
VVDVEESNVNVGDADGEEHRRGETDDSSTEESLHEVERPTPGPIDRACKTYPFYRTWSRTGE